MSEQALRLTLESQQKRVARLTAELAARTAERDEKEAENLHLWESIWAIAVKGMGLPDPLADDAPKEAPTEWLQDEFLSVTAAKIRAERDAATERAEKAKRERDGLAAALDEYRCHAYECAKWDTDGGGRHLDDEIECTCGYNRIDPAAIFAARDARAKAEGLRKAAKKADSEAFRRSNDFERAQWQVFATWLREMATQVEAAGKPEKEGEEHA